VSIIRHRPFLREVAAYALTAFGGPSAHLGAMTKTFVNNRRDVTQEELTEIFSFCQLLPGPSSTQTVTLIGYKRGGVKLAVLTLMVWMLPACIAMAAFALILTRYKSIAATEHVLRFIQPMAIGFLIYAISKAMQSSVKHMATLIIMIVATVASILLRSPWTFPVLLILGSVISNASSKRIAEVNNKPAKIKWVNLKWFLALFLVIGILSELARVQHWNNARLFNLFENFYRFGSLTWGGGHALMPIMHEQFINLPLHRGTAPFLTNQDFLTGFGMMNSIPGPVFSVSAFVGAMAMQQWGTFYQILGAAVASIGVFLPSTLLVLFFFPVYKNLKQHTVIYRALEGISAVVLGTMCAGVFVMCKDLDVNWLNTLTLVATFVVLRFTKLPAPVWVLVCLLLGIIL
jgi:chromate transporter